MISLYVTDIHETYIHVVRVVHLRASYTQLTESRQLSMFLPPALVEILSLVGVQIELD